MMGIRTNHDNPKNENQQLNSITTQHNNAISQHNTPFVFRPECIKNDAGIDVRAPIRHDALQCNATDQYRISFCQQLRRGG
mmetsp:Transcript_14612/g.31121  ORF Transcript_14612/g.31121 Transcript_14612/m.31121 type:complete len:81 (+) Transcript_14612:47-289(+)